MGIRNHSGRRGLERSDLPSEKFSRCGLSNLTRAGIKDTALIWIGGWNNQASLKPHEIIDEDALRKAINHVFDFQRKDRSESRPKMEQKKPIF